MITFNFASEFGNFKSSLKEELHGDSTKVSLTVRDTNWERDLEHIFSLNDFVGFADQVQVCKEYILKRDKILQELKKIT